MSLRRDNHYVPRFYLKRFAGQNERIWTYRTLVSHSEVPVWKERSTRGVAVHSDLYTRLISGQETDEIEKWLDQEFEAPAEEALRKATSDARLTPSDWERIVRFFAAQDVRTPKRLAESLDRWYATIPDLLENSMQESVRKLEAAMNTGEPTASSKTTDSEYIPFRVTPQIVPNEEMGYLKGEIVVGRGLWLFSMKHSLSKTAKVLHQHKWTILRPPDDLKWFTSDAPVIRLNFYGNGKYDFEGGWANPGTDLFLPLSPHHLLYAQVGQRPPVRGDTMPREQAHLIRRFIAEHADRMIFTDSPDAEIPELRPRLVDAGRLQAEKEQWRRWHDNQAAAERRLMGWDKP